MALGSTACGDDGATPIDDTTTSGSATSSPGTSATETSASTDAPSTSATTVSTTVSTTQGETSGDTTASESSTGEPMNCGLSENPDEPGPWFTLENHGAVVETGATIALECGGQGSLMFYLRSSQGGFVPEGETVYFAVTMDVEGFDALSPTGHFFEDLNYGLGVGCSSGDEFEGGFSLDGIALLPPDALTEPSMVDGLPATLHVEMLVPDGEPVILDATVTLMVDPNLTMKNCGF